MKNMAEIFIVGTFFLVLVMSFVMTAYEPSRWSTKRSPDTGICYEVRMDASFLSFSRAMSPVDDSFCEDK